MATLISSLFRLTLKLLKLKLERHYYEPFMYMRLQVIYKSRASQIHGATTDQESFSLEGIAKIVLKHLPVFECVIYLDVLATCLARYADDEAWDYNSC